MKKWMMIATAFLALSGVSGAALYQQHVSAKSDVKTTTVKTVTKKTTNQPKATSKSQASLRPLQRQTKRRRQVQQPQRLIPLPQPVILQQQQRPKRQVSPRFKRRFMLARGITNMYH